MTVLAHGDQPELYGLPRDPTMPLAVRLWKGPLKWLGNLAMLGGSSGRALRPFRADLDAQEDQNGPTDAGTVRR